MSGRIGMVMLYLIMLGEVDDILIRLKIFGLLCYNKFCCTRSFWLRDVVIFSCLHKDIKACSHTVNHL